MRIFIRHTPAPIKCRLPHRRAVHLQHQPVMDHLHHIALLLLAQRAAVGNGVPFFQTAAAAGGGRMLGDKYRMAAHRRLLTVVHRFGGRQPLADKIPSVLVDDLRPLIKTVLPLFDPESKA